MESGCEMEAYEHRILLAAINTFGAYAQSLMLLEEMSELQKEICKNWRGKENVAEIAEEIADVRIMLKQMEILFDCAGRVRAFRAGKIRRLEERIRGTKRPLPATVSPAEEVKG